MFESDPPDVERAGPSPRVDFSVPNPARMYDYFLGGKDHYRADREAAEKVLAIGPDARVTARANRDFLRRAVTFMAGCGVRQFIDIGTGLPTMGNTHEIAQQCAPDARVVYVDNDPVVIAHARALMVGTTMGEVAVVPGDLRHPKMILTHPAVTALVDFGQPVGVLLAAVMHFVTDAEDPPGIMARISERLAPGSYLVWSHATGDNTSPRVSSHVVDAYEQATVPLVLRDHDRQSALLDEYELVPPGLVSLPLWRPKVPPSRRTLTRTHMYAAVGRKQGEQPCR